jgi:hypothetical protein
MSTANIGKESDSSAANAVQILLIDPPFLTRVIKAQFWEAAKRTFGSG